MLQRPTRQPAHLAVLALLAFVPLGIGCEAGGGSGTPDGAAAFLGQLGAAEFAPVNQSDITGTVRFEEEDDGVSATIELVGLQPGAAYPASLHTGRCAAGGPVAAPLGPVTAGEDGRGRLTAPIEAAGLEAGEPVFVQAVGPEGDAVACADMDPAA